MDSEKSAYLDTKVFFVSRLFFRGQKPKQYPTHHNVGSLKKTLFIPHFSM